MKNFSISLIIPSKDDEEIFLFNFPIIKEFLLSKKKSSELAFSVVRLDSIPSQQVIDQINSLDEVQSIQLLNC